MWKNIRDNDKYFLSLAVTGKKYEIIITDFICCWTATYTEKTFIDQLKISNEGLLFENDKEYLKNALHLLTVKFDKVKRSKVEENGEYLLLTMRLVTEYPFSLECKLSKCPNDFFFEKVTQPLLKTISELKSSQDELIQLLIKKDKEIKAYKRELDNRKIIFPHEETKQFNDLEHQNSFTSYVENFGSLSIPTSILKKSASETIPAILSIKQEPNTHHEPDKIKEKPYSIKQEQSAITQELNNTTVEPCVKQEISAITHELNNTTMELCIKQEQSAITQELNNTTTEQCIKLEQSAITQELNNTIVEPSVIKVEPSTSEFEDNNRPLVSQSPRKANNSRKKLKLSY